MMDLLALTNLLAWSLQIALLTIAGAILMRVLRVDAPVIRHAYWRALLIICLALPVVQPWRATSAGLAVQRFDLDFPAPASDSISLSQGGALPSLAAQLLRSVRANWISWIGFILAFGTAARLAWITAGILRLRRLRKAGEPAAPGGDSDELRALVEAGSEIRYVPGLGQPVTFGVLKPVVLLPDAFSMLPSAVQRVVLAHELWHVRRHDWAWVLVEETIRAAFWFNPAVWWLVSKVQSSREEVVDELTVQLTNARRMYLEALLAFADEPSVFPATPFARRRHLFHRMLLISREAVMSSRRIVASSVAMTAVVLLTGWHAASTFPLAAAPAALDAGQGAALSSQNPPRDRRPGEAGPETARERELKKAIETGPAKAQLYVELAKLQEARGAKDEAEATLLASRQASPTDRSAVSALAGFYNRIGQFEKAISALEDAAAMDPSNPEGHQHIAVFYWEKAFKDKALTPTEQLTYVQSGIAATDRALTSSPDYVEALVYKNILLRMQANLETDTARQRALVAEADVLRNRAMELQKARRTGSGAGASGADMARAMGLPPPPPPPPPPPGLDDGQQPVRVGGNIKPPTKVRDVKPVYPADAQAEKVQGVVILETTIDPTGRVANARVLRGVPMLDQAALDAVYQWEFTPTLLNNVPVPVIMTVTVNFTLQ